MKENPSPSSSPGLSSSSIPKRVSRSSSSLQPSARTRAVHSTTPSQVLTLSTDHLAVWGHAGRRVGIFDDFVQGELVASRVLDRTPGGNDLGDGAHRIARPEVHHLDTLGAP